MIDTHTHIYSQEFDDDRAAVVQRALQVGITHVVLANEDSRSIQPLKKTVAEFPDFCFAAMGLHPESVKEDFRTELQIVGDELAAGDYCAVGEIGLDLYWDDTFRDSQILAFEQQLDWAISLNLPVVLHVRKAFAEAFASLAKFRGKPLRGVFHCFGGGVEEARKVVKMGFYLGVGGVLTFKKSHLPEIVSQIGVQHIMLETDAPYMAPVPHRGQRNEPQFVADVAQCLAEIFQIPVEKIDETTTQNAKNLFGI